MGSLLVIDNKGNLIQSFAGPYIQGPWDMALLDGGDEAIAFISNAFTGSITRLSFRVRSTGLTLEGTKTIASGFMHRADPAALFVASTGLVYDRERDTLYIASSEDNAVFAIEDPLSRSQDGGTGRLVYKDNVHLHGALAMAMASNGDLLVSNNDVINVDMNQPSEIVELYPRWPLRQAAAGGPQCWRLLRPGGPWQARRRSGLRRGRRQHVHLDDLAT